MTSILRPERENWGSTLRSCIHATRLDLDLIYSFYSKALRLGPKDSRPETSLLLSEVRIWSTYFSLIIFLYTTLHTGSFAIGDVQWVLADG